ncbi:MAG: hypothetical protein ACYS17_12730 [Planctomycetota bacterium]|jgi:hypothetical protein
MKTPLDNDLNKVYETFNQNHNNLRQKLMASLPDRSKYHKRSDRISYLLAFTGDTIMKNRRTKLAAAAVIIIALFFSLPFFQWNSSGIALADVLAQTEKVKAFRYKLIYKLTSHEDPDKPYFETRAICLNSEEYGWKRSWEQIDPNGGDSTFTEDYFLPQKKTKIRITPKQKKYTRVELDDARIERSQKEGIGRDPVAFLKRTVGSNYKSLGIETIDDHEVEVFKTTDPNWAMGHFKNPQVDVKICVDVKTRLPVRYESNVTGEVGDMINQQFVMYDFQWDISIDAADFEPVIPDDYTGTVVKPLAKTEENAIKGLRQCIELFGNYPESLDFEGLSSAFEKSETPAALQLKEELKELSEGDKASRLMDDPLLLRFLIQFRFRLLTERKAPEYYGKTVTPKDADKVLMRWKASDNEYRVIFGDLHAETVTAEELAELEKLVSK